MSDETKRIERQQDLIVEEMQNALQRLTAAEEEIRALRQRVNDHDRRLDDHDVRSDVFGAILDRLKEARSQLTGEIERAALGGRDERV